MLQTEPEHKNHIQYRPKKISQVYTLIITGAGDCPGYYFIRVINL